MRSSALKKETYTAPTLKVVHKETSDSTQNLIDIGWNFAYCCLWNATEFSSREIDAAKSKINQYLSLHKDPERGLISFCERILLARYYVAKKVWPQPSLPSLWLDRATQEGFSGTKKWYDEIKSIRLSLPKHKVELRAMAEAVIEFASDPTVQNYNYWRSYLIDRNAPSLLGLFQVTAIHFLCNR